MAEKDQLTSGLMIRTTNGNAVQNPLIGVANKAMAAAKGPIQALRGTPGLLTNPLYADFVQFNPTPQEVDALINSGLPINGAINASQVTFIADDRRQTQGRADTDVDAPGQDDDRPDGVPRHPVRRHLRLRRVEAR